MNGAAMPGAQAFATQLRLAEADGAATVPVWFPEAMYGPKRPVRTEHPGEPAVAIPYTRGAGAEVEGQVPNVVYYVCVWDTGAGERWVSEHRYSDFHGLREQLLDVIPVEEQKSVKAMAFPKKKLFSYGQDTTEQRRQNLEQWLVKLVIGGLTKFKITPKPEGQGFPSETLVYDFLTGGGETAAAAARAAAGGAKPHEPDAPPADEPSPKPAPAAIEDDDDDDAL